MSDRSPVSLHPEESEVSLSPSTPTQDRAESRKSRSKSRKTSKRLVPDLSPYDIVEVLEFLMEPEEYFALTKAFEGVGVVEGFLQAQRYKVFLGITDSDYRTLVDSWSVGSTPMEFFVEAKYLERLSLSAQEEIQGHLKRLGYKSGNVEIKFKLFQDSLSTGIYEVAVVTWFPVVDLDMMELSLYM